MLQAAIFDLDGTLLDTKPDFAYLLNQLLHQEGRPEVNDARLQQVVSAGARAMIKLGFSLNDDDPILPGLLERFLDSYESHLPQTMARLYDDIDLLIASLHEQGLPWGIMTNKLRRFSAPLLRQFESFNTCSTLVCPDDVAAGKPDPRGILQACRELDIDPEHAVYIGDHPHDMEAARNAGMPGIAVSWGYLPGESSPDSWGASFIAETPQQLLQHLLLLTNS